MDNEKTIRKVTWIGFLVNLVLSIGKLCVGWLFASQALVADGIHSFSDMITDIAILIGVKFWSAPPDAEHPYGHHKIETMITLLIGAALALAGIFICWDAISGLHCSAIERPGMPTLIVALISIVLKEWLFRWTRDHARRIKSVALEANAWHHRSDAVSSIPAALAIGISFLFPGWAGIDEIGAIIVSIFILHSAWQIMKTPLRELTDTGKPEDINLIRQIAFAVPGVLGVHAVRTRFNGSSMLIDLHLLVDPMMTVRESHSIATNVQQKLIDSRLGIQDVLIHVEPDDHKDESLEPYHGILPADK